MFIQRYKRHAFGYKIRYDDPLCSNATAPGDLAFVSRSRAVRALSIMKAATHRRPEYRFSVTFFNYTLGFFVVDRVNGTAADDTCFWNVFIESSDKSLDLSINGASNTHIWYGQTLILSYMSVESGSGELGFMVF